MEEKYKQQDRYFNRIVVCLYTTQVDKLPEERQRLNATRDELDAYFDDSNKDGNYYIREIELPTAYSITHMYVGNYNKGWVWMEKIRPVYELK